jgi:hypothetical protein
LVSIWPKIGSDFQVAVKANQADALAKFDTPSAGFRNGDLYVFYGVDGWPDPRLAGARRLTVCGDVGLIEVRYVRGCLKSMA